MQIDYTRKFLKQFNKQRAKIRATFYDRLEIFKVDPSSSLLHDHSLKGNYQGYRSINVSGDIRALYTQRGSTIIIFAFIGSHSELYS